MANRQFQQFSFTMEKYTVKLYMKVAIGASGAPTLSTTQAKGISSISRNSAGDYSVTLQDNYYRLLGFKCSSINASGISASPDVNVKTDSVTSGSLRFVCSVGGVATDPASGDSLLIEITLSNSSAI